LEKTTNNNNVSLSETQALVKLAAALAAEKKATDILILNIGKVLIITDYFLICTVASSRQALTVSEHIREKLREKGRKPLTVVGEDEADWILLDYGDFVIHIFTAETRAYYRLEQLWKDAEVEEFPTQAAASQSPS
jgi:ribosome-associated protein